MSKKWERRLVHSSQFCNITCKLCLLNVPILKFTEEECVPLSIQIVRPPCF